MKKFTQEKIRTLASAFFAAVVVVLIGYAGLESWDNHKLEQQKAFEASQEEEVKIKTEEERVAFEKELKEQARDEEIVSLKQQILDLQNKAADGQKNPVPVPIPASLNDTLANIVKEWSPRVAHIECSWFEANGKLSARATGSATIVNFSNIGIRAVTNKHLFTDPKSYLPRECKIELLDKTSYSIHVSDSTLVFDKNYDSAYVTLPYDVVLWNLTKQKARVCNTVNAGDSLVVLGYPKIGSKTGITVTEGIVSGLDETYYITSAKIDKGNSGGAAILVKDDCYLGIPTASVVGQIESLGRILKASFVIGN